SMLLNVMDTFDMDEVDMCPIDALQVLNRTRIKTDLTQVRQILKKDWKLRNQDNSLSYQKMVIWSDGGLALTDAKGRYYTITKSYLQQNFTEDQKIDETMKFDDFCEG
ncbi:hypothetical protein HC175_22165, partial [Salinimicrobium sp. CDJ15-91]|nr:hypothetical protein [Salinimicrobium oceani]